MLFAAAYHSKMFPKNSSSLISFRPEWNSKFDIYLVHVQETSSTDDSDEKAGNKNICEEQGSDGDHSFEASQSKTKGSQHGKGKRSSSDEKAGEENICDEDGSDSDHSLEATQSKTNGSQRGKGKRTSSNHDGVSPEITDESTSDAFEDELQLPGNL